MRLGFRKAGRGRTRGKSESPKNPSTVASAASTSGWTDPWPPPWPDEVMSGRGGSGAGGSRCGSTPAGGLCFGRARGTRGLRATPPTSVVREVTTTSAALDALLTSVERDTAVTTECARFGRSKASPAACSRGRPAFGAEAGEVPEFVEVVEIGVEAAMPTGWVAGSTSVTTGAEIFRVVGPATLRLTLWPSGAGAC
jgi:hypothetical protein